MTLFQVILLENYAVSINVLFNISYINVIELDQKHFNNVLRRDIVSKVYHYFNVKGKVKTKMVKRKGDVAGSGKKPAQQKGRGMARIGNLRAP